jgi:hypothetical protein
MHGIVSAEDVMSILCYLTFVGEEISFAIPDRGICEDLDASVTVWHADEYHYQLHDVLLYVG